MMKEEPTKTKTKTWLLFVILILIPSSWNVGGWKVFLEEEKKEEEGLGFGAGGFPFSNLMRGQTKSKPGSKQKAALLLGCKPGVPANHRAASSDPADPPLLASLMLVCWRLLPWVTCVLMGPSGIDHFATGSDITVREWLLALAAEAKGRMFSTWLKLTLKADVFSFSV